MMYNQLHCQYCSVTIGREHPETFLFSCPSCQRLNSTDPSVELGTDSYTGRKIVSPSVLQNANTINISGALYRIRGQLVLLTTGVSRTVHILLSTSDKLFYLFECLGEFYLASDEPFLPAMKKASAGSPIDHDNKTYIFCSTERIESVMVNGEVKFPIRDLPRSFLGFTFEKDKIRLMILVSGKDKKALVLTAVDPAQISRGS